MAKGPRRRIEGFAGPILDGVLDEVAKAVAATVAAAKGAGRSARYVDDGGVALRAYADRLRQASLASRGTGRPVRMPKVAAEFVSASGNAYYGHNMNRDRWAFGPGFLGRVKQPLRDPRTGNELVKEVADPDKPGGRKLDPSGARREHHFGLRRDRRAL